ncbi:type II toxin-antitoxin system VapC family toxin [Niveispirillum sp.]|uniref:type II toxin-antitoxin system VapC family toxin n=1 Tax=Niveispirillum sp. TaxID=1917217 RepID=UPI001B3D1A74|nr:type II toxin-antitoxin system VapC family toxin [Niveispirillum sp.]MBP7339505.1 type II toxin-antitoxin system VapC family toxin [Niveispirillum sp.]
MFLLDTNVLFELRRPDRANAGVVAWAAETDPADLFVSAITLFEIEVGAAQVARRDPAQGLLLRAWIDGHVMPTFKDRILPVDAAIAQRCARLHVPDRQPQNDSLIAATALVHRLTLVTRNVRDFDPMRVAVLNPWRLD